MKFFAIASLLSLASIASAVNYTVIVGGNNTLTYNPPQLTNVTVGDTIAFQLYVPVAFSVEAMLMSLLSTH